MENEVVNEVVAVTGKKNIIGAAIGAVGLATLAGLAIWKHKKKKTETEDEIEIIDVEAEEMEE